MRGIADEKLIRLFMKSLGQEARAVARVFFTGGTSAVLLGWRASTIDIDLACRPDCEELFQAIPRLKEALRVNVELACPSDFIPELEGWEERSRYIASEARLQFFHYDFYAQALAKIERGHAQDRADVAAMLERSLVDPERLRRHFAAIEPRLHRYPAIDPSSFRRALERALGASTHEP